MKPARRITHLRDRAVLEAFLRRNPALHIYSLGDLDDFFWPRTHWYGLLDESHLRQVVLFYRHEDLTTLLALTDQRIDEMGELLGGLRDRLPARFHAHVSPGLAPVLQQTHALEPHGLHYKLVMVESGRLDEVQSGDVERLSQADLPELRAFYRESYPGNWFAPRMLETNLYFGIRRGGRLVSVAGIHVYSARLRVAALGNVATHPEHRGAGLATRTCARLCRELRATVDTIGANVRADNTSALACYQRLGFARVADYEEHMAGPLGESRTAKGS